MATQLDVQREVDRINGVNERSRRRWKATHAIVPTYSDQAVTMVIVSMLVASVLVVSAVQIWQVLM